PATMAAFQGLAHDGSVTYALEGIISAPIRKLDNVIHHVFHFFRIDKMCHAELAGHGLTIRVDVNPYDLIGAHHARPLNHIQPDTTQAKHNHIGTGLDLGSVEHCAQPGRHAAADI